MKRTAERQILEWKNRSHRKPLIIRGARQTGKTWLAKWAGEEHFEHFVHLDFEKRRDLHSIFSGSLDPTVLLKSLELVLGRIVPGKTLLFLDEIQACPRALMALRYFYEELPELHVIAAGSLLEFAFDEISVPVGRVSYLFLQPMSFYEYLLACVKEPMAEEVLSPVSGNNEFIQREVLKELKNYFLVGGMPEAVRTWGETGSLQEVFTVQDEILISYRDDFSKYKPRVDIHCLDEVFRQISLRAGEQIKYAALDREFTSPTNRKAFELLEKAGIVKRIYSTDSSGIPLGAGVNTKRFKAVFLDIGLMQRLSGLVIPADYFNRNILGFYQGKLAEQFAAQELAAAGMAELYYWARESQSSTAEVDFMISVGNRVMPLEIKSGRGGSLKSLHLMLARYPQIPSGTVLYDDTEKHLPEQKLDFYPLYHIYSLALTSVGRT